MNLATLQQAINNSSDVSETLKAVDTLTQEKSMDIHLTATEFFKEFANQDDAIDFILASNEKGLVQVSENTLPFYTLRNGQFVAFGDWQPNVHSFDVRIERWYGDDECSSDAVVRFDYTDGIDTFWNHLHHELDGVSDQSEMHWQDNPSAHRLREAEALMLQVVLHENRIQRTRRYLAKHGLDLHPNEFDANCKTIANLNDFNDKAFARIEELGY